MLTDDMHSITPVCGKSKFPGGSVDLEQIRKVDRTSRSDCTEAKRRKFVFDSSIDWTPVQSAKMKCKAVSFRRFQDETKNICQKRDPVLGYLGKCVDGGVMGCLGAGVLG